MKVRSDYIMRDVAGTFVVIPTGMASASLNGIITLNKTGAYLYKALEEEKTEQELLDSMTRDFNIDEVIAQQDVGEFISKLREAKLLE